MSSPPIPNLPPISTITDPAVRSYLQALTNAWAVRNGQVGDGMERFLTLADLEDGIKQMAVGSPLPSGKRTVASILGGMIQRLSEEVQTSRLWRRLGERLDKIEVPEWFSGRFGAEIKTEQTRVNDITSAIVDQTTIAISAIEGNVATLSISLGSVSDTVSATATDASTLQVALFGSTDPAIIAEQLTQVTAGVDGVINGTYSVKFDANGYVTGFGLGLDQTLGGDPSSLFAVRADRFAIGPPLDPDAMESNDLPFVVTTTTQVIGGVTYPPGVWMKSAFIVDASITSAKIANAAITSAKIASAAIAYAHIGEAEIDTLHLREGSITFNLWQETWGAGELVGERGSIILATMTLPATTGAMYRIVELKWISQIYWHYKPKSWPITLELLRNGQVVWSREMNSASITANMTGQEFVQLDYFEVSSAAIESTGFMSPTSVEILTPVVSPLAEPWFSYTDFSCPTGTVTYSVRFTANHAWGSMDFSNSGKQTFWVKYAKR